MKHVPYQPRVQHPKTLSEHRLLLRPTAISQTTATERLLLMATVVLLPLQDHIPSVAGFSVAYLMLGALAFYTLLFHLRTLAKTWSHPVFLAGYALIAVGMITESFHPHADLS